MEKIFGSGMLSQDGNNSSISSISAVLEKSTSKSSTGSASVDQSHLLLARPPRQVVSLWTCSKVCAICFVAGVFVGYTLKRRVRRWASKLLRRLKDE